MVARNKRLTHIAAMAVALVAGLATIALASRNHVSIREDTGWIATAIYPQVSGDSQVEEFARQRANDITAQDQHDFIVWAKKDVKSNGQPDSQYAYDSTPTISVNQNDLVSLSWSNEWDTGGEHPTELYDTCSVGLVHGKPQVLALGDLFRTGLDAKAVAATAMISELKQDPDATDVQEGRLSEKTPGLVGQFYIGQTAIAFILSTSITGRYAVDGATIVKVPFSALTSVLDVDGPLKPLLGADHAYEKHG
jgi:hypothetical protein